FFTSKSQVVYTTFLLLIIPAAFLFSSQMFLDVSRNQQETLEEVGITLMLDTLSKFTLPYLNNGDFLQEKIISIAKQNDIIVGFDILRRETEDKEKQYRVIAALDGKNIDELEEDIMARSFYDLVSMEAPYFKMETHADGRHQMVAYPILDSDRNIAGIIALDISMAEQDRTFASNIQKAYIMLFGVVILIGALLIRQAKVIDYAVLYKRLKEIDQMKDDFVSMAAHELRTPLTIIRGYTDMLASSKRMTETDRQMTTNIEVSAKHLNQMIGDILDVSRLQQGRLSFDMKIMHPNDVIHEVVESLKYTANKKGLELTYEPRETSMIEVDLDRLKQVLINIVGNSVKYTPEGSVTVTSYNEKDMCMIRVSDTGIGISSEDQEKLFSRFYRVRSKETEEIRGTGLGLWITKEIVTQMKGKITVESIKGKGTDFIISFPTFEDKDNV
ncbi:MAG: HAMP domain-containing histidine kinase, partial [Candidatus Pacebacteria bacterium]|nr:HAMP domain-containing histidine kinase [Candidatus Paceibacterota bacterium]